MDKIQKRLKKAPRHIREKLLFWAKSVELLGIHEVRKAKGYHDEPLRGKRKGQRSIRLSRSWRAIYSEEKDSIVNMIIVEEINSHEY